MDPYKVLGVDASKIKHDSDLVPARKRAKLLYKRHSDAKNKFEAKKVLEAYEMIKGNLKGKVGEGQYKLIGRSRKERELDKHFNHQTKEIKNDKGVKRQLQMAQQGERRMRLRGDKERVARPRRRAHRRHSKKKQMSKKHVDSLQGLQKLSGFLEHEKKFPKAIPLLNRWVREYMNQDNRGYIFELLHKLAKAEYVTEDSDSRQHVIQCFEYVMGYFSEWFEKEEEHKMLYQAWRMSCVLSCHCHTDDAFMLSRTITSLNEALTLLETNKEKIEEEAKLGFGLDAPKVYGQATPPGSPLLSDDGEQPSGSPPVGSPSDGGDGDGDMMEDYGDFSASDSEADEAVKENCKDELKVETKMEFKEELVKEEVKVEVKKEPPNKKAAIEISLDSDDDAQENVIDSEDSVHDIDSGVDDVSDGVFEELSSGSESGVECVDTSFKAPSVPASLRMVSEHFVFRCLGTLFSNRGPMWARPKIDAFFQDVFYRREIFTSDQQTQIEAWQARIKVLQKNPNAIVGEANNPMEAHRPVIDSREMVTSIESASSAWSAKQTIDSRDRCGGSRVLR